jgi:HEPN domain-containing protein
MNKTARIWILQALHDLEMAEKNLTISGFDVAAFLCHQAVENLLKALIAAKGEEIPKIHYCSDG